MFNTVFWVVVRVYWVIDSMFWVLFRFLLWCFRCYAAVSGWLLRCSGLLQCLGGY